MNTKKDMITALKTIRGLRFTSINDRSKEEVEGMYNEAQELGLVKDGKGCHFENNESEEW